MPGIAVDRVRYVAAEGQRIFDFPRLYIDGSSWVWKYGLGVARAYLDEEVAGDAGD